MAGRWLIYGGSDEYVDLNYFAFYPTWCLFGFFFSEDSTITNYQQVMACHNERFNRFFHLILDQGVYLAPTSYEAGFVSSAHTPELIDQTLEAAKPAFARL